MCSYAVGTFVMRLRNNRLTGDLPQELSFLPLEVCSAMIMLSRALSRALIQCRLSEVHLHSTQ